MMSHGYLPVLFRFGHIQYLTLNLKEINSEYIKHIPCGGFRAGCFSFSILLGPHSNPVRGMCYCDFSDKEDATER